MTRKKLYTIGFTRKDASEFFSSLKQARVTKVLDIRLNNVSQLAGFTKRDDLVFFLREICNCDYRHVLDFAPTREILDAYKRKQIDATEWEKRFSRLIRARNIEQLISPEELNNACLLCSEPTPEHCHRRLVAEYLQQKFGNIEIINL